MDGVAKGSVGIRSFSDSEKSAMRGGWRASVEGLGLCDGGRSRGVAGLRGRGGSLGEKRDPHLSPSPALRERGYRAVVEVGRVKGSRRGSSPGVRGWRVPLVIGRRNGGPWRLGGSIRRGISPMKRSEERRVGNECVSQGKSRGSAD